MNQPRIRTVDEVDQAALGSFLGSQYGSAKAAFLETHGEWWHRGEHNRWVIEHGGQLVAYCAVIPTAVRVAGELFDAVWWVDLVVGPAHRGLGLQRAFDNRVRGAAPLILGFPNALAARIHRRHHWGLREDLEVRLLPLRPLAMARARITHRAPSAAALLAVAALEPFARRFRAGLSRFESRYSQAVERPSAKMLAGIFFRGDHQPLTTYRDPAYLAWRYLEAPYRQEIVLIVGGRNGEPSVAAVLRVTESRNGRVARLLDVFGTLDDVEVMRDVVRLAAKIAMEKGAIQLTAMASQAGLSRCLRGIGFVIRRRSRFCWVSQGQDLHAAIEGSPLHLVLGDSDNDAS